MIDRLRRVLALLNDPRVPKLPRLLVLFAVIYAFLPVDLIPDFAPVIGWIDDLTLLWVGLRWLLKSARGLDVPNPPTVVDTTAERLR